MIASDKYKKRLKSLKKGIVLKFGKGSPKMWRNRDFEDLSFEIRKATKVLISAATLKRIFGKNKTSETYYPQESTLEALEVYAGDFLSTDIHLKKKLLSGISIVGVFIVFILLFVFNYKKTDETKLQATVVLTKIEGHTPSTAFFNLDIPLSKDPISISFGDGNPDRILSEETSSFSHVYNYPGLFDVLIKKQEQSISDTLKVLVPTSDWQALAHYYQQESSERYYPVPLELAVGENGFHPSGKDLSSIGIDTTQIIVTRLDNFKQTNSIGDNFQLRTRLKNTRYWPAIRCYSAYVNVVGEKGLITLKFTNEGCSGFGEFVLSEKSGKGSNSDLTGLTLNMKEWNDIEIRNQDKLVTVDVAKQTVFEEKYFNSIGKIVGVSLQFHGSGYVDYFELLDGNNAPLFTKNF